MATEAQTNANRQNAKKSTGPRTPEGKNISSRNSLVHGMTSRKFLPPDGDSEEYFQLLDRCCSSSVTACGNLARPLGAGW